MEPVREILKSQFVCFVTAEEPGRESSIEEVIKCEWKES